MRKKKVPEAPKRITNDTVAEHRKQVLAGGRKFKYPLQYARHKLVINTIIISVFALIFVGIFGWWQLYPQQNTSNFAYRVTAVLPVPVASIDGEQVRYSDYLLKLRSAEHYLQQKEQSTLSGGDSERQVMYLKQQSLRDAIADAYALRIAREKNITITDQELKDFLDSKRKVEGGEITERTQYAVIRDYYNWSPEEYAHVMRVKLLRQKVAYEIDQTARAAIAYAKSSTAQAEAVASWQAIVNDHKDKLVGATYGASGMVPKTNQDGGLAAAAARLKKGEVSGVIQTATDKGYSYAIVRLIDSNATQVSYEFILVPATELQRQIDVLYNKNAVNVYIKVDVKEDAKHE
jgi:hypothetical protein